MGRLGGSTLSDMAGVDGSERSEYLGRGCSEQREYDNGGEKRAQATQRHWRLVGGVETTK